MKKNFLFLFLIISLSTSLLNASLKEKENGAAQILAGLKSSGTKKTSQSHKRKLDHKTALDESRDHKKSNPNNARKKRKYRKNLAEQIKRLVAIKKDYPIKDFIKQIPPSYLGNGIAFKLISLFIQENGTTDDELQEIKFENGDTVVDYAFRTRQARLLGFLLEKGFLFDETKFEKEMKNKRLITVKLINHHLKTIPALPKGADLLLMAEEFAGFSKP